MAPACGRRSMACILCVADPTGCTWAGPCRVHVLRGRPLGNTDVLCGRPLGTSWNEEFKTWDYMPKGCGYNTYKSTYPHAPLEPIIAPAPASSSHPCAHALCVHLCAAWLGCWHVWSSG